jgi:hypothetical protein
MSSESLTFVPPVPGMAFALGRRDPMDTEFLLQWDMHGVDTFVSFVARQTESGFVMVVTRDGDSFVMSDTAADAGTLFQKSEQLRRAFEHQGYMAKPGAQTASRLAGGVCWGPGSPVRPSVLHALTDHGTKASSRIAATADSPGL